jgi:hypothetical protein
VLVVVLALTGCGSSGGTSAGSTTHTRDPRCTNVPASVAQAIAKKVTGGTLQPAQAVKSFDYESPTFFVSAKLASGDIGTWATSKLGPGGVIYAVDDIAKANSTWPDGDTSSTYVSMIDDGAELSRDCVG